MARLRRVPEEDRPRDPGRRARPRTPLTRRATIGGVGVAVGIAVVVAIALLLSSGGGVVALSVHAARTPPLDVPNYITSGTYPQVSADGVQLGAVNAALRSVVVADQRAYAPSARKHSALSTTCGDEGTYRTLVDRSLTSASSEVVSALVATLELYPCGNDGSGWLAITLRVPSATHVKIASLFTGAAGLRALAASARTALIKQNRCVRDGMSDTLGRRYYAAGFGPTAANYKDFALLPRGLAVGFPLGQVSFAACGRVEVTVPYGAVRAYLSSLGRRLVDAVRAPRR